jgi:hypothetical protein
MGESAFDDNTSIAAAAAAAAAPLSPVLVGVCLPPSAGGCPSMTTQAWPC